MELTNAARCGLEEATMFRPIGRGPMPRDLTFADVGVNTPWGPRWEIRPDNEVRLDIARWRREQDRKRSNPTLAELRAQTEGE